MLVSFQLLSELGCQHRQELPVEIVDNSSKEEQAGDNPAEVLNFSSLHVASFPLRISAQPCLVLPKVDLMLLYN